MRSSLLRADDRTLAVRSGDGDVEAFAILVRRLHPSMYAYALTALPTAAEADRAVQSAYLSVWRRLPDLPYDHAIMPWMLEVLRQICSTDQPSHPGTVGNKTAPGESGPLDALWLSDLLGAIRVYTSAGQDIPLENTAVPGVVITEGAVRQMVRSAADRIPGLMVQRSRLVDGPNGTVVEVEVVADPGRYTPAVVRWLATTVRECIRRHTRIHLKRVDVILRPDVAGER